MHIPTLIHGDPRNMENFRKWINSLDYGSKPYCREFRLFDLNVQEVHKDKFLADLKHYYKANGVAAYKKNNLVRKIINFIIRFLKLQKIDMDSIEPTPDKWFRGMNFAPNSCGGFYLFPLGGIPDGRDCHGHEEI